MRIFVGNLAWSTTKDELEQLFESYGIVDRAQIVTDRETGRSRGFGFVEMPDSTEAQAAIAGLNGTSQGGRPLTVNEARQREERDGPREQGDAGDYGATPVQWPGSFTCHSNPEKLPYACQTSARHVQR